MSEIFLFDKDIEKSTKLKELLERKKINVKLANDPKEAIELLKHGNSDFLVLDIEELAGKDEFDFNIIRKYNEVKPVPIAFIISDPDSEFSPLKSVFEVEDIILKPYREEEVSLRILNRLKRHTQVKFFADEIHKLNVLFRIGSLPQHSLDIDGLTENILKIIKTTFECESAAVYIIDEEGEEKLKNSVGPADKEDLGKIIKYTTSMVIKQKIILFFDDLSEEIGWRQTRWKKPEHLRNAICIPLESDGNIVGSIEMYNVPDKLLKGDSRDDIHFLNQVIRESEKVLNLSTQFAHASKSLQYAIDELTILYEISDVLSSTLSLDELLKLIVRKAMKSFNAQVTSLMMLNHRTGELSIRCAEGLDDEIIKSTKVKLGEGVSGRVAKTGQPLLLVDMHGVDQIDIKSDIKSALCVPLKIRDEIIGVLNVSKTSRYQFTENDLKLLYNLASLAAQAMEKASLYKDIKDSLDEIKSSYMSTVAALSRAIEAKDPFTLGHIDRVAKYGLAIALELDPEIIKDDMFRYALVLHDIGKIEIPDAILTKDGALSDEERAIMRRHPEVGARILQPIKFLKEAAMMVKFHQEYWDGSGYPEGLKGDEIPLVARIISVADAFDAITTNRPYRKAKSIDYAREEILRHSGTQFDPKVIEAFLSALDKKVIP